MLVRTFAEPRALVHELARLSRLFTDGYHTLNSHLRREEWSVLRGVSQLNSGGVAAMEDLARQIRICVDVFSDPCSVSWTVSRFYTGTHRAGDALVPSLRRHVARKNE